MVKERAIAYAQGVIGGDISACLYVRQAAQRFLNYLNRDDFYFDDDTVGEVVNFIESLYLNTNEKKHFKLEDWQLFVLANIYGFRYKSNGKRVTKYVYVEIPRKNGKSELITAIAMYHFLFEKNALVTISANSREQAKLVDYKKVKAFAHQIDPKEKYLIPYYNQLKFIKTQSEIVVTSSDSKRLDGLSVNVGIIDEYHSARDSSVYDVIKSAQGAVDEPLLIVITTAGFDTESPCYSLRSHITAILQGLTIDDSQFGIIYTLDEGEKIDDSSVWKKANPNLGISLNEDFLKSEVNKAINLPSELASVQVKNFNLWLQKNSIKTWLPLEFIEKNLAEKIDLNDFKGAEVYAGVDLGTNTDITVLSFCIKAVDGYVFKNFYYLPENSLNTNVNKRKYKEWANAGYLTLTEGNVTDYDYILNELVKYSKILKIKQVHYDKYNATQFAIDSQSKGVRMIPFSQNAFNFNIPTKQFERFFISNRLKIDSNPVTKWQLNNVVVKTDYNGNIRPIKNNNELKIDGVVAMIMALAGFVGVKDTNIFVV